MEEKSSHEVIRMTEIDSQSDEAAGQGCGVVRSEAPAEAALGTTWRLVNRSHFPRQHQKKSTTAENLKWAPGIVSLKVSQVLWSCLLGNY